MSKYVANSLTFDFNIQLLFYWAFFVIYLQIQYNVYYLLYSYCEQNSPIRHAFVHAQACVLCASLRNRMDKSAAQTTLIQYVVLKVRLCTR
jgi:hypothetical protein